jgi:hypothetical protein
MLIFTVLPTLAGASRSPVGWSRCDPRGRPAVGWPTTNATSSFWTGISLATFLFCALGMSACAQKQEKGDDAEPSDSPDEDVDSCIPLSSGSCGDCQARSCCAELESCVATQGCVEMNACIDDCLQNRSPPNRDECTFECAQNEDLRVGYDAVDALYECADGACPGACGD